MEFKGTKGSFKLIKQDSLKDFKILCIGSDSDNTVIAHVYFQGDITEKELANALLFSKSKEMLEMLQFIYEKYETDGHLLNVSPSMIKNLINQATEL